MLRPDTQILRPLLAAGTFRIRARGDCMSPSLVDGALLEVQPRGFYWPGDVVVTESVGGEGFLVHRVIGLYLRGGVLKVLTQADTAARADAAVPLRAVVGRVCGGDCAPEVVRVPWTQRARAVGRFLRQIRRSGKGFPGCLSSPRGRRAKIGSRASPRTSP